jgi:hypothetical protein
MAKANRGQLIDLLDAARRLLDKRRHHARGGGGARTYQRGYLDGYRDGLADAHGQTRKAADEKWPVRAP